MRAWKVKVDDGSVAFGIRTVQLGLKASLKWKKRKITFKDVFEYCANNKQKDLAGPQPRFMK